MEFVVCTIRESLVNKMKERTNELFSEFVGIYKENEGNKDSIKYKLIKWGNDSLDYFDLIILDSFLEGMYSYKILDENLTDSKRFPKGSYYSYGNYFEKKVISILSEVFVLESTQKNRTDAIFIDDKGEKFLLEVKCTKTDTNKQVDNYLEKTGLSRFATINGSKNYVDFNALDVYRISSDIFEEIILKATLKNMEEC